MQIFHKDDNYFAYNACERLYHWKLSKVRLHIVCFLITKTRLYNFDPLKPHFYIVKLGFTGVYIIFLVLLKT